MEFNTYSSATSSHSKPLFRNKQPLPMEFGIYYPCHAFTIEFEIFPQPHLQWILEFYFR